MSDFSAPVPPPPPPQRGTNDVPTTFTNHATMLPDIFTIVRSGFRIFKDEAKTLMGLGALNLFGSIVFAGILCACMIVTTLSLTVLGVFGVVLMAIVTVGAAAAFYWYFAWIMLGMVYAIKSHGNHVGIKDSLRFARPHVWAFMWVNVLAILIALGAWILFCLAATILLSPFYFLIHGVLIPLATLALIFAGIIALVVTATWFGFANWTFIDENGRGLHAIALSKHLSHRHFISVATRVFLVGLLYMIVMIAIKALLSTIFWSLPILLNEAWTEFFASIFALIVAIPVTYCVFFSLYSDLRVIESIDTDSTAHGEHRGILLMLAAIGLLGLIVFPIAMTAGTMALQDSLNQDYDAQRQASIDSLQNDLQLYYLSHDNLYPNSIAQLTVPGTSKISGITADLLRDPASGKLYSYQTFNQKQAYKLCAHLSTGIAYCVAGDGKSTATPVAANSTSKTAASSTPKTSKK